MAALVLRLEHAEESGDRIIELIDHPLLEGDDRVVGDLDVFRADHGAALGDVAVADPLGLLQIGNTIGGVQGMHFQRSAVDEMAWADEFVMLVVVAKDMADVLAQEALDAFPELLYPVDIVLAHVPGAVWIVGFPGSEGSDRLLCLVVVGHIGDKVRAPSETRASARRSLVLPGPDQTAVSCTSDVACR